MLEHIFELWFGLMVFLILTFGIFDGSITKMMMGGNETINQVLYRVDVGHRWVTYERAFPTFENCRKDDTHSCTLQLLEANSYFGMEPTQVKLLKQMIMMPGLLWIHIISTRYRPNLMTMVMCIPYYIPVAFEVLSMS
ncbi:uncharacterized protein LOC112492278 isoform X2 [Ziziphus jujuba]|uniref:Uncharacterized protein LOC112492278 isoform X2 n=1 Tax=Ziziphus jujuba TaxID=326968 RepID=A0ABM4A5J9_ZIZJJ|nr:uncharacterized protein LOC112492278 isoform X2 [Ziziphus jujuba]